MGGESGLPKMPSIGGATGPSMLLLMNLNDVDLSNLTTKIYRPTDQWKLKNYYWFSNWISNFKFRFYILKNIKRVYSNFFKIKDIKI